MRSAESSFRQRAFPSERKMTEIGRGSGTCHWPSGRVGDRNTTRKIARLVSPSLARQSYFRPLQFHCCAREENPGRPDKPLAPARAIIILRVLRAARRL